MSPPALQAQASLPQLGDGQDMSLAQERKLGNQIARSIYRDPDYLDDPLLADYVQRIWQPLLQAARKRGDITPELDERFAWEVMLARDRTVNAFALPGGYLGVHLGLIALVGNRDELASVLAHELSHVTQRHIARLTAKQSQQAPWILGAMILGALSASKNPEAANAVIAGSQAAGAQAQLNFSRDMEREADRIGYQVLQDAGFAVQGFVGMFDKLALSNRINDNGSFPYLRTHPLTSERIGDMQARLQLGTAPPKTTSPGLATEHALMASRARLLANPASDTLRSELQQARALLKTPSAALKNTPVPTDASTDKNIAQLYSGAWAALRLRELDAAQQLVQRASELHKYRSNSVEVQTGYAQAAIDLLAIEIAMASNSVQNARSLLLPYLQAQTLQRPVLLAWGRIAVAQSTQVPTDSSGQLAQLEQVSERLQSWIADHPRDALAWDGLATVYAAQGLRLRAIRAQAESKVAVLDYSAALDRFKAGQELGKTSGSGGNDYIESSIIDVRARAVQAQMREFDSEPAR